jgi:hypothetical protein
MSSVSIETLRRWRNRATSVGHLTPLKQPGRPKKHSPREIRLIRRKATQNPSFSINRLKIECGVDACHQTMVKILKEYDLQSFVAIKKPLLSINHVRNRLRWGNEHLNMDVHQWKRWTFSDESTVELDCSEGNRHR